MGFSSAFSKINTRADEVAATYRANAEKAVTAGYLCGDCAELLGATWPKNHRASFPLGQCPICHGYRPLSSWDDWEYLKVPDINERARRLREFMR